MVQRTFSSRAINAGATICGALRDNGRDCNGHVDPDAPINLCDEHLRIAFHWFADNGRTGAKPLDRPCPTCGQLRLFNGQRGYQCGACGYASADYTHGGAHTAADVDSVPVSRDVYSVPVVYYVQFRELVKIGTTRDLKHRMGSLLHDELLAVEQGSFDREAERHEQFDQWRYQGEWFTNNPALEAHIRKLRAGVDDPWAQVAFWEKRRRLEIDSSTTFDRSRSPKRRAS